MQCPQYNFWWVANGKFINWLEAKITNENAKILASPTLILGKIQTYLVQVQQQ